MPLSCTAFLLLTFLHMTSSSILQTAKAFWLNLVQAGSMRTLSASTDKMSPRRRLGGSTRNSLMGCLLQSNGSLIMVRVTIQLTSRPAKLEVCILTAIPFHISSYPNRHLPFKHPDGSRRCNRHYNSVPPARDTSSIHLCRTFSPKPKMEA